MVPGGREAWLQSWRTPLCSEACSRAGHLVAQGTEVTGAQTAPPGMASSGQDTEPPRRGPSREKRGGGSLPSARSASREVTKRVCAVPTSTSKSAPRLLSPQRQRFLYELMIKSAIVLYCETGRKVSTNTSSAPHFCFDPCGRGLGHLRGAECAVEDGVPWAEPTPPALTHGPCPDTCSHVTRGQDGVRPGG